MKTAVKWLSAGALASALLFLFLTRVTVLPASILPGHQPDLENGARLFHAGGCASCHARPQAGEGEADLLAGGLELKTPFGLFRVPNISPDKQFGIGSWSLIEFVNAMQRGVSPQGRHYYPAFPYTSYARMPLEDLIDLKVYLDTLPPVAVRSGPHELDFPWNIRRGLGLWKLLYLDAGWVVEIDESDALLTRGRYLVEGPGHCGECHSPRSVLGGMDKKRWLAGATDPEGEGRVSNITPHADGLASWSPAEIAYYLESGFTPDYDTVGGSMVEVQENMALLPGSDRQAIAAYLKAIPASAAVGE